ncbi:NAD(P)/FAD-dependent oxidoreductase [Leptospira sp. 96542]|nr:NAD(P)/FAD-dependent oxidoreductase [Leptospira sp. 96542]
MENKSSYEVVIVGGSVAGLSAAMTLGRSLRSVLVIDKGEPCNRQTPHSHNFITQDGVKPHEILAKVKNELKTYKTIEFASAYVTDIKKPGSDFLITTEDNIVYAAKKIILATGVKDLLPNIPGFSECWGISVLHCPYCHGYEVHSKKILLFANGDIGYEFCKLLSQWSSNLTLLTNGKSTLSETQTDYLLEKGYSIVEKEIQSFSHKTGNLESVVFTDGSLLAGDAIFARVPNTIQTPLILGLGVQLKEDGLIQVDDFGKTNVTGVYAAGDNTTMMRSVANAAAQGNRAGAFLNKELIEENF